MGVVGTRWCGGGQDECGGDKMGVVGTIWVWWGQDGCGGDKMGVVGTRWVQGDDGVVLIGLLVAEVAVI